MTVAKRLGLEYLDSRSSTCVGQAKTLGRRCRNPIAFHNVSAARSLLARIDVDSSRKELKEQLHELARLLLCQRWHSKNCKKDQVDEVVDTWYELLVDNRKNTCSNNKAAPTKTGDCAAVLCSVDGKLRFVSIHQLQDTLRREEQRQADQWRELKRLQDEKREEGERRRAAKRRQAAREQVERERAEREWAERERQEREEAERKQAEREEAEREKSERERKQREKEEAETQRQKARARRERDNAAKAERERQAQARREQVELEWAASWSRYIRDWTNMARVDTSDLDENIKDSVPWPVKSGTWQDVSERNVLEFFRHAPDGVGDNPIKFRTLMRQQALRWHEDKLRQRFRKIAQDEECLSLATLVMRVINGLR